MVGFIQGRRPDIVTASPFLDLFIAVFFNCRLFMKALESPIVSFNDF